MRVGIIGDTHGYLDPQVLEIFSGVHRILHAGDIGRMEVIKELEKVAPVVAVCGNHESPEIIRTYPRRRKVVLDGVGIYLTHDFGPIHLVQYSPLASLMVERLEELARREGIKVVIFGHTHSALQMEVGNFFLFNPGYSGGDLKEPSRTVGLAEIEEGRFVGKIISLSTSGGPTTTDRDIF